MAGIKHDDVAEVLAGIANVIHRGTEIHQHPAIIEMKVARVITDFVEQQPDNLIDAYQIRLEFIDHAADET